MDWYRVSREPQARSNDLADPDLLRTFAASNGIGYILNTLPYRRARNDLHPNVDGNRTMACDTLVLLKAQYALEMKRGISRLPGFPVS